MPVSNNINEDYENLFGRASKVDLFDPDEDYYNNLRQEIIDTPRIYNVKKQLPFEGVYVPQYLDYRLMEEVKQAEENGYHVFYLSQSEQGQADYCFAAGYYIPKNKLFTILRFSRISYLSSFAVSDMYLKRKRMAALMNKTSNEDGQYLLNKNLCCYDPRLGACLVTGRRVDMDLWRDNREKDPTAYYRNIELAPLEDPNIPPPAPKPKPSTPKPAPTKPAIKSSVSPQKETKHLFYLNVSDEVKAFGYFEPETKYFYICKGSTIEEFLKGIPENSDYALNRKRLIDKCAEKHLFCWKLIKDAKCRTATVAATYVKGRVSEYVVWKDEKGLGLSDVYPQFFKKKAVEKPVKKDAISEILTQLSAKNHLFYIRRQFDTNDTCDATGHYDPASKTFILHKDSVLSLEVTSEIRYSALDIQRRFFIKKHCIKQSNGYRLLHDNACSSPDQAALFALGCKVDGWEEWEDKDGKTLGELFKK